jgi:HlyD family secretion protein
MRRCLIAGVLLATACTRVKPTDVITASGQVEATDVRLASRISGRLAAFPGKEGDRVAAGQEVARIDTAELELALRQVKAEGQQAGAELRLRQAGPRPQDVAELQAQIASVRVEREAAQRDLDRMQGLLDRGSGTTKARDDARTRRDVLDARLGAMAQALARVRSGSRPQEIDAASARTQAVGARAAQIEQQIKDASVTSPIEGVITEKLAEAGEMVPAGSPLAVVTNLSDAWLSVYVAETDLGRIRLGQDAQVVTDDGQERHGRVAWIASRAEFTPRNVQTREERARLVFKVKVALDNGDGLFKPGMPATARFGPAGAAR